MPRETIAHGDRVLTNPVGLQFRRACTQRLYLVANPDQRCYLGTIGDQRRYRNDLREGINANSHQAEALV
jgi:hypothetical protein